MRSPRSGKLEALPSIPAQALPGSEVMTEAGIRDALPCLRCGECCSRYQVRLDLVEARRIADGVGLTWEDFWDRYTDPRWPGERSLLLRQIDGRCPFMERVGERGGALCAIHSFKPLSCREWTPGLHRRECQAGLAERWGITVDSMGNLRGPDERMRDFRSYLDSLASDRRT